MSATTVVILVVGSMIAGGIMGVAIVTIIVLYAPSRIASKFSPAIWGLFKRAHHHHVWRTLTGEDDYGKFGRHFGDYCGRDRKECMLCGKLEWNSQ